MSENSNNYLPLEFWIIKRPPGPKSCRSARFSAERQVTSTLLPDASHKANGRNGRKRVCGTSLKV